MKKNTGEILSKHAHGRTDQVREKLRGAMKVIELEIEQNEGIYPFHGGRLSLSEVCRRAGVHKVTMQGPSHRDTSKPMVEAWINGLKSKLITGRKVVRKEVTARAGDWQARYKAVANKFNEMYAIDVIAKERVLKEAQERIAILEAENLRLQAALSNGVVVQMPTRSKKDDVDSDEEIPSVPPRLILVRGLPGSGKSTRANEFEGYLHLEADMFFLKGTKYEFDETMLQAAHQWCLKMVREALVAGKQVVVSNVFASIWEISPYVDLGYHYEIIEAKGKWRSVHNVPPEKMKSMRSTWVSLEEIKKALAARQIE